MSATIALAIVTRDDGQLEHWSVDKPQHVEDEWMQALNEGRMMKVRVPKFEPIKPDHADHRWRAHAGTPRRVTQVSVVRISPHWVASIHDGLWPEATEEWRCENDPGAVPAPRELPPDERASTRHGT